MPRHIANARHSSAADLADCRELIRTGSLSFHAASFLLPREIRDPAIVLYAFCRIADDAIDNAGEVPGAQERALERLRARLDRLYDGRPMNEYADRALADVVRDFHLPKTLLDALLEGFEWDVQGRRYEDLSGVYDYSARVAGTVGALMSALMGARSEQLVARACDLGVAMQITNICRDVGEDARLGRIYLPLNWLREAGIDPDAWLRRPVFNEALASVIRRLLDTADLLYRRSDAGIAELPLGCRAGINAARYLYSEIGRQVERQGLDSISRRAVVPTPRKVRLLAPILGTAVFAPRALIAPPLAETRFLVDAVVESTPPAVATGVVWVLDLFQRLEERERALDAMARYPAAEAA